MAIRNVARMERIDIRGGEDLPRFATLNAGYGLPNALVEQGPSLRRPRCLTG
jgi:hypothetical protein